MADQIDLFAIEVAKAHEEASGGDSSQDIDSSTLSQTLVHDAERERNEKTKWWQRSERKEKRIELLSKYAYLYIGENFSAGKNDKKWLESRRAKWQTIRDIGNFAFIISALIISLTYTFIYIFDIDDLVSLTVKNWWWLQFSAIFIVVSLPKKIVTWALGIFVLLCAVLSRWLPGTGLFKFYCFLPLPLSGIIIWVLWSLTNDESRFVNYFQERAKSCQEWLRETQWGTKTIQRWIMQIWRRFIPGESNTKTPHDVSHGVDEDRAIKAALKQQSLTRFQLAFLGHLICTSVLLFVWGKGLHSIDHASDVKNKNIKYDTLLPVEEREERIGSVGPSVIFFRNAGFPFFQSDGKQLPDLNAIKWAGTEKEKKEVLEFVSTNEIVQVGDGALVRDGYTISVTLKPEVPKIFEFDSDGGVTEKNIAVKFDDGAISGTPHSAEKIADALQQAIEASDTRLTAKHAGSLVSITSKDLVRNIDKRADNPSAIIVHRKTEAEWETYWRKVWMDLLLDAQLTYNVLPRLGFVLLTIVLMFYFRRRDSEPNLDDPDSYYFKKLDDLIGPPAMFLHLDGPQDVTAGSQVNYQLRVEHQESEPIEDIRLELESEFPGGTSFQSETEGHYPQENKVILNVEQLSPEEPAELKIHVTAPSDDFFVTGSLYVSKEPNEKETIKVTVKQNPRSEPGEEGNLEIPVLPPSDDVVVNVTGKPKEKEKSGEKLIPPPELQENWFVGYLVNPPPGGWQAHVTKRFKVDHVRQIKGQEDRLKLLTDLESACTKIRRLVLFVSANRDPDSPFINFLEELGEKLDDSTDVFVAVTEIDKLRERPADDSTVKNHLGCWQKKSVEAGVHQEHFKEWNETVPERFTEWLDGLFGLRWPGCHEEALELLNKKACEIVADPESNHDLLQESKKLHSEIHKLYLADYNKRKMTLAGMEIKAPDLNLPILGEIKENIAEMGKKFQNDTFLKVEGLAKRFVEAVKEDVESLKKEAKWITRIVLAGLTVSGIPPLQVIGGGLLGRDIIRTVKIKLGLDTPDPPEEESEDPGRTISDDEGYQLADLILSNAQWILYLQLQGSGEGEIMKALDRVFGMDDLPDDPLQTGDEISQLTEVLKNKFSSEVQRMRTSG